MLTHHSSEELPLQRDQCLTILENAYIAKVIEEMVDQDVIEEHPPTETAP
jgi:hypothetical protein